MNLILGIGLLIVGIWLSIVQGKNLLDGKPNMSGGITNMFIAGLGCIACGIIEIVIAMV